MINNKNVEAKKSATALAVLAVPLEYVMYLRS